MCPALGLVFANLMFLAPLRDLHHAVQSGLGLGTLNPTPFAFMLGNCFGWSVYGILLNNWFLFWANYPGFLIACWLNLGAIKLVYAAHHQDVARTSLVRYLSSSNNTNLITRNSMTNNTTDTTNTNINININTNTNTNSNDTTSTTDETKEKEEENNSDTMRNNTTLSASSSSSSSLVASAVASEVAAVVVVVDNDTNGDTHNYSCRQQQQQQQDEDEDDEEQGVVEDWATIIWDVTSQTTPARIPHEQLVMGMIVVWTVVVSSIGFYGHYARTSGTSTTTAESTSSTIPQQVVGYVVNVNLVFFYGAPLSAIAHVVRTKQSDTVHVPTMLTNTCNSIFWTVYAVAPQINDPFIYVPNGLGVVLGLIQGLVWVVYRQ